MKIKKLKEAIATKQTELRGYHEAGENEKFNTLDTEIRGLEEDLAREERMAEIEGNKNNNSNASDDEVRGFDLIDKEIREAYQDSSIEVNIGDIEIRDGEMVIGTATGTQTSTGNIKTMTFAQYIIKRLPFVSALYGRCRKEVLKASTHAIPVQKKKLPKFVKMKELEKYAKEQASYDQIKMEATKYGTLVVISEECMEDTGYDITADVTEQLLEGYALTLEELIVVGDTEDDVQGLNSFEYKEGDECSCKKVIQETQGAITIDEIEKIYFSVPKQYRKNATWVMNDDTARLLNTLKYDDGRKLLSDGYNGKPFGEDSKLLNCPVIVNNDVDQLNAGAGKKGIFFGDLEKALIVAPRRALTIKKSTEYGWIEDSVAFKANVRLDIKRAIEESMAYYELIGTAPAPAKAKAKAISKK